MKQQSKPNILFFWTTPKKKQFQYWCSCYPPTESFIAPKSFIKQLKQACEIQQIQLIKTNQPLP